MQQTTLHSAAKPTATSHVLCSTYTFRRPLKPVSFSLNIVVLLKFFPGRKFCKQPCTFSKSTIHSCSIDALLSISASTIIFYTSYLTFNAKRRLKRTQYATTHIPRIYLHDSSVSIYYPFIIKYGTGMKSASRTSTFKCT